jgi:uracil-DNA glycosylase, family 4
MITLAKNPFYSKNRIMEKEINIKSALEYYLLAGVDETVGDRPFELGSETVKASPAPVVLPRPAPAQTAAPARQATTELAQATATACKNAHEICSQAKTLEELRQAVENFEGCALKLTAAHTVFGDGNPQAKIVLIGEAPGADEDRIGIPFVGRSGKLLDKMLAAIGLDRSDYYITNILPWRPPGNRTPTGGEIAVCLPFLKRQLEIINPDYILLLGGSSANALFDNQEPISRLRGRWLEYPKGNGSSAQALATFHPAYLLRNTGQKAKAWTDLLKLYKEAVG